MRVKPQILSIPAAGAGLTDSQSMRALPVQPEPLWRTDFRQRIAMSLWFVPTIFAVAAIAAANLTIWLDAQVDAPIGVRPDLVSDPGSAATFAGAIAAATLAFVAVVVRRLHGMLDELQSTLPAGRQAAIARQRSLLAAAAGAALPAPFTAVASAADREGLG